LSFNHTNVFFSGTFDPKNNRMKKIYFFLLTITGYLLFFAPAKKNFTTRFFFPGKDYREFNDEKDMGRQEEVLARIKQELLMTKDPQFGYVPTERLEAARQEILRKMTLKSGAQTLGINSGSATLGAGLTWEERGPSNIGGRCRAVLVDHSDASNNTVYIGSVSGGLWKTTNFTSANPSWSQIGSVSANLAITSLARDPTNSSIMYAGTGEGYFNID
jgi:hypothetical protein